MLLLVATDLWAVDSIYDSSENQENKQRENTHEEDDPLSVRVRKHHARIPRIHIRKPKDPRPAPYFEAKVGFEAGGTVPFPLPAQMRKIDGFSPKPNFSIQALGNIPFSKRWELVIGAIYERKGMTAKSTVKDYSMSIKDEEGTTISGRWTGGVTMEADQFQLTMPLEGTFNFNDVGRIHFGAYFSYVAKPSFSGEVYDGYLREGDPTGSKIEIDKDKPQSFDFSEDMRRFQWGVMAGGEWFLSKRFSIFADLTWGMNDIFLPTFKTITFDMFPIYGVIGVGYSFRK